MKKRTLRTIPRYLTLISLILLTIFGILFYCLTDTLSQKRSLEYFEGISAKAEQSVSTYLQEIQRTANLASYSRSVQEFLFETSTYLRAEAQHAATDLLSNIMAFSPDICEIAFVKSNGILIQSNGEYATLLRTVAENQSLSPLNQGKTAFFSPVIYNTFSPTDVSTPYFLFVYPIYSLIEGDFSAEPAATCLILAKLQNLGERHLDGLDIDGMTVVLMEGSRLVFSNRPLSTQEETKLATVNYGGNVFSLNRETSLAFRHSLEGTSWDAIITAPESAFSRDLAPIKAIILFFILTGILLLSVLLGIGTHQLSAPLRKLLMDIQKIDLKNESGTRIDSVQVEEIDLLSGSINDMLDKISQMELEQEAAHKKLYQASLLKKQAQLQYYRSQINPHFLYNTLECISAMARISGISCIESICTSMADLFRYSVSDATVVTLQQEITHAENYYNVIAQRTTNRYFLKTSISQECREKKVQKMILQPLLENAVKHGFEGREAPCCLLIRASLETNGELCLLVADNGFGIPPARAKQLNAQLQKDSDELAPSSDSNIGLFNINQRLKLAYNGESRMEISSRYGFYTCIRIWLPPEKE